MNKFILTNQDGTETILDKEYIRVASKPDGVAVFLKGGFDNKANSLEKNKLYHLSIYVNDSVVMEYSATFVSYNFLLTVSAGGKSDATIDNTLLLNILR